MKITDRQTIVTRDETIRFDNGEVRPVPYSRDGKRYRADILLLRWTSRDNGDTWALGRTEVRGQVLRRDGSDSKNRTDETFWPTSRYPDWVRELIDDTDPTPAEDGAE